MKTTMIAIQSGISTIDQDQLITPNIFRIINIINTGPNIDLFFIFYFSIKLEIYFLYSKFFDFYLVVRTGFEPVS